MIYCQYKNANKKPNHGKNRNSDTKYSFSRLVIHRPLHPEPDSEHPTTESKNPECLLGYSPPSIDRFELIDPHERVGKEIDDKEGEKNK